MKGRLCHDFLIQLQFRIKAPGKEGTLRSKDQTAGIERVLDCAIRRGLGDGSEFRCRRILSLGKTVNLVVEQNHIDVYVPSDGMDEVVAADCQGIAVATGLPHGKGRVCHLDAGGNRRGPSVNGMEAVGVHIIWKT